MLEELFGFAIRFCTRMWRHKAWRPHLLNAAFTFLTVLIFFFYINFKHNEAMAAIRTQESMGTQIFNKLEKIGDRVDDLYRLVARGGR